ncbi:MAG: DNA polymerase III subunit delta [bacterium]
MNPIEKFKTPADLPPVVLLAGAEGYLIERYTQHLIDVGVAQDMRDFNLDTFYCPDTGAKRILEIARSFPMMAEKRMVVVKDANKLPAGDMSALVKYAAQPSQTTCLVLLSRSTEMRQKALKELSKKVVFVECKKLYESQATTWIEKELKAKDRKIQRDAISLLVMQVGTNLRDLMNEIEKLLLYVDANREITSADVAAVAGFRKEYTIFALQNALGERDLKLALDIYDRIRQGMAIQAILFQISKYFTKLLIATGFAPGKSDGELAKLTQTHTYFVKELHKHKSKYSGLELENALENIRQVDFVLKTFPAQENLLIQQLFTHIVRGFSAKRLPFSSKNI